MRLRALPCLLPTVLAACGAPNAEVADFVADHPCQPAWAVDGSESGLVFVDPEAAEGGAGSHDAPFQLLEDGLDAATAAGGGLVLVAPGTYRAPEGLRRFFLSGADGGSGVAVLGCGSVQTFIEAIEASNPASGADPELQPAFEILEGAQGVTLAGFTLSGGFGGLNIGGGAGSETPITLRDLQIVDGERAGLSITGNGARVVAADVHVRGIAAGFGSFAMGVVVHEGGSVWDPPTGSFELVGGSVFDVQGVGVLVDHAQVHLTDVEVADMQHAGAAAGRGIQAQNLPVATFERVDVHDTAETGIFLLMPSDITMTGSSIRATQRVPGAGDNLMGGDGLAVVRGPGGGTVDRHVVHLLGNRFENNGRAGGVAEDVTVYIDTLNVFTDNGLIGDGESFPNAPPIDALVVQGETVVLSPDGDAAMAESAPVGQDSAYDALDLQRDALPVQ